MKTKKVFTFTPAELYKIVGESLFENNKLTKGKYVISLESTKENFVFTFESKDEN